MFKKIKSFFDLFCLALALIFMLLGIVALGMEAITANSLSFNILLFSLSLCVFGAYGAYLLFKLIYDLVNEIKDLKEEVEE